MKRNKLLAFVLSLCLTVGLLPTLSASASVKDNNTVKIESKVDKSKEKKDTKQDTTTTTLDLSGITTAPISEDALKESKGVKGKIGKAALKAAARVFRSSGLKTTLNGLKYLGFSTSTVNNMVKYSYEIADVLDELSTWTTVVRTTIADQILSALTNMGVGYTTANDVAWWVSQIIDWGVL